jgi:hypothetical protein
MITPHLDILKRHNDGSFMWIESVVDIDAARRRLKVLADANPGEYFVFDQRLQQIVATTAQPRPVE